jgi:hypothetical protein
MTSAKRAWRLVALGSLLLFGSATFAVSQEAEDAEDEAPERSVTLDTATVGRLGIATAPLEAAQFRAETSGFGVVMAVDVLAQTDADLATAESAVEASRAALARARALFAADTSVSRQTVEAAERQASADAAQLTLAQRRAVAVWGQGLPWRNATERSQLFAQLSAGELALARVTFPTNSVGDETPSSLRVERVDAGTGARRWTATTVWSAPADPAIPGRSFFALVRSARGLQPGERLLVFLPQGGAQRGVIVPSSAVLIAEGQAWYYAAEIIALIIPMMPLEDFTRHMLDLSSPAANGYFVADGQPGQSVVVEGAGLLLARELGSAEGEED